MQEREYRFIMDGSLKVFSSGIIKDRKMQINMSKTKKGLPYKCTSIFNTSKFFSTSKGEKRCQEVNVGCQTLWAAATQNQHKQDSTPSIEKGI